jgi:hypothetical protein
MLHVTNGDAAADAIRSTGLDGDWIVWRDVLHEGPVPAAASDDELREIRAAFLARCGWAERDTARADLARRDARLAEAIAAREEIVLWFESDLYDQLQLAQVLDRLSRSRKPPRLTAIESQEPLGALSTPELVAAYAGARGLGAEPIELGRAAWAAFRAEEPRGLERLLGDATALPSLGPALVRHLEQFPSYEGGVSRSERQALAALADGPLAFDELFEAAQRDERPRFLGDSVFRLYLERLSAPPAPLVTSADDLWLITDLGRAVHDGEIDWLSRAPIDRWLGGVRLLSPRRVWRWDPGAGRLVAPEPLERRETAPPLTPSA